MSENCRQIEAALFKPTPSGFIYKAPNPWIFGRADHYVVSAAQKTELLGILVAPRPLLRLAMIIAGVLLWAVAGGIIGWAFSPHEEPTIGDVVIMIMLTIAGLFLALHLAIRHTLRRVQPILAGTTRTTAVITASDIRSAMNKAMSFKGAVFAGSMFAVNCAAQLFTLTIRNSRHPLFSDAQSVLNVFLLLLCAAVAIKYFRLAIGKVRRKQADA